MSIDVPFLKKFAPALRHSILVTCGGLLSVLALIVFVVLPARARLAAARAELAQLSATLSGIKADISGTAQQQAKTAAMAAERDAFLASGVIEPLLGSFAMRGKSLVDPVAQQTGFTINSVKELPFIPLQVPLPAPEQLYGRQPIEFTGLGSYAQITAFVSGTEASLPLATLSSITILSQPQTPESHKAIISFEWPVKGEKRTTP